MAELVTSSVIIVSSASGNRLRANNMAAEGNGGRLLDERV